MAGHVALFQLHAADAVLEAPLPRYSRYIDLESGRSVLPRVFTVSRAHTARASDTSKVPRSGVDECGSAMYLRGRRSGRVHKITPGPRTAVLMGRRHVSLSTFFFTLEGQVGPAGRDLRPKRPRGARGMRVDSGRRRGQRPRSAAESCVLNRP